MASPVLYTCVVLPLTGLYSSAADGPFLKSYKLSVVAAVEEVGGMQGLRRGVAS